MLHHMLVSTILAAAEPVQESFFSRAIGTLNSVSGMLVFLTGVLLFAGACYLIATKQRPAVIASYLVLLPLPILISLCGFLKGIIASLSVVATSANVTLTTADIAAGVGVSLFSIFVAVIISIPTYFVVAWGLLRRTYSAQGLSA